MIATIRCNRVISVLFRSLTLGGILFLFLLPTISRAQITLDGSLGPKGPLAGPDYAIDAKVGQLRGDNLFHSFGQFNVHTGESATFTGPSTVENVIGRVTGGQQSLIDGQLRSEMPKANLYLLNPSGVMFGPNATLDVPGSFHVSTADYLRMANGEKFSANLSQDSMLTSAPPAAFGFLSGNPASISIQGSALKVPEGKTLSVIGGDIQITSGNLSAPRGQLNLASVASAGEVIPTISEQGPDLKMEGFSRLGKIEAVQGAHINTDGEGGGSVVIRAGQLVVDNAVISSNAQGNTDGARVGVDAQIAEDVAITNAGRIESTVTGAGNGGSTELKIKQLTLTDGARIDTSTHGEGRGGTLSVTATDSVSISGRDSKGSKSGLFSNALGKGNAGKLSVSVPTLTMSDRGTIDAHTEGDGNAGSIEVQAGTLTLTGGARILASSGFAEFKEGVLTHSGTGGPGRGGDVTVNATESISIAGGDSDGTPSGLYSGTVNKGDAGKLFVSTPLLQMAGGAVSANTLGDGNAGDIDVEVGQLMLTGGAIASSVGIRQFITSAFPLVYTGGPGRGGNLTIHATEAISLLSGGVLATTTGGKGDAGKLFVSAPVLLIDGRGTVGGIFAFTVAEGNAGNIDVQVGKLTLQSGGQIFTGTGSLVPDGKGGFIIIGADDTGRGGNITIHAGEAISISGQSSLGVPSGLFTVAQKGSGAAGQLFISAPILELHPGGQIASGNSLQRQSTGNGGGIRLEVGKLTVDGAFILSNTVAEGNGGDIDVQVGQLTLQNGGQIFSGVGSSVPDGKGGFIFIGADHTGRGGNLTVKAREAILISGQSSQGQPSGLFTNAQKGSGAGGQLFISAPILELHPGGDISSGTGLQSTGNAGNIRLEVGRLMVDGAFIDAFTLSEGNGGDIDVQVGQLTLQNGGQIVTPVGGFAPDGKGGFMLIGTDNSGRGGNITVKATESISISGQSSSFPSALATPTQKGRGAGGQIFISTPVLDVRDGGAIASSSVLESTGNAGDIRLKVGKLTMSGDATISSGTEGPGKGGDIQVQAQQIELNNNEAAITASSSGAGNAGNITIHADDTFRSNNSVVSTSSTQSGGGKIDLSAGHIVELVKSQVTTSVQGGAGDAGNITIDPHYVILNDSQVIARAVEGNGGNINIGADVFIASPTSVVDASSQKGISGTVDIRGVVNNLSGSLVPLPQGYLNITALSEDRCAGRLREGQVSSFVVTGLEGMPLQPGGVLPSPLYEAGQVRAQGGPGSNDGRRVVWQVPRIIPIALDGGCGR